jgi:hypothetical protein
MGFMHPLRLLDFWWHLKVGEVIATSGHIPRVDLFSFTRAGTTFLHHDWLAEVLYHLVYRAGGPPLEIGFNALLLLLAFAPILHLCLHSSSTVRLASLCSIVAALSLGWHSNVRPQVFSFLLFAWFYWVLWAYLEGWCDRLWTLPLLMVLWVNLHGAYVLGLALMGVVLAGEALRRATLAAQGGAQPAAKLAKLALVFLFVLLACTLNPEGPGVFAYVRQLQVDRSVQLFVREWQVPEITDSGDLINFFAPFFFALLLLSYARRRFSPTEFALFLTFAALGLTARRHGIWFTLIVTPMLARHSARLQIPGLTHAPRPEARPPALPGSSPQPAAHQALPRLLTWLILVCLLLFTFVLAPWTRPHLGVHRLRPQLLEEGTPVEAMDYIAEQQVVGNIFHPQAYGDYLIWRLWPQQRSFIDGRVHLFDASFWAEYLLTFRDEHWESRLANYDIQYLLLPKGDQMAGAMISDAHASPNWRVLYEDDKSILFGEQL